MVEPKGQVVIPKEFRKALGIISGSRMIVKLKGDGKNVIKRISIAEFK